MVLQVGEVSTASYKHCPAVIQLSLRALHVWRASFLPCLNVRRCLARFFCRARFLLLMHPVASEISLKDLLAAFHASRGLGSSYMHGSARQKLLDNAPHGRFHRFTWY